MAEEKKIERRGGKRPGAGRKPKSIDCKLRSLSKEDLQIRRDLESLFKNGNALKAPEFLDDIAYAKWNEIMLSFSQLPINVLNILDTNQFVLYCQSWSRYKSAVEVWQKELGGKLGSYSKDENRYIKQVLKVINDEISNMKSLAPDLLLTPTGRVKYGAAGVDAKNRDKKDSEDAFDAFLERLNK